MPEINKGEIHREVYIDQRYPRWWDKWVNPTTILAVLGGIIWGIQLNIAVITHTSEIAKLEEYYKQQTEVAHAHSIQIAETTVILKSLVDRIERIEDRGLE